MTNKYNLPVLYDALNAKQKKEVREQYVSQQGGKCFFCGCDLTDKPHPVILNKDIDLSLFPPFFLKYPIHLQHSHETGLTECAVHSYCNAVMWQYFGE